MNRRLYFILPDVEISRKVEDDLLLARISEHEMHFLVGGIYGGLTTGLFIGSSTPNVKLKEFQNSMDEGHILLMVDVAKDRVDEIRSIIHRHFPEAEDYGEDHTIPAFP